MSCVMCCGGATRTWSREVRIRCSVPPTTWRSRASSRLENLHPVQRKQHLKRMPKRWMRDLITNLAAWRRITRTMLCFHWVARLRFFCRQEWKTSRWSCTATRWLRKCVSTALRWKNYVTCRARWLTLSPCSITMARTATARYLPSWKPCGATSSFPWI